MQLYRVVRLLVLCGTAGVGAACNPASQNGAEQPQPDAAIDRRDATTPAKTNRVDAAADPVQPLDAASAAPRLDGAPPDDLPRDTASVATADTPPVALPPGPAAATLGLQSADHRGNCRGGPPRTAGSTMPAADSATVTMVGHGSEYGHHCNNDQGRFAYVELTGDFDVSVQVAENKNGGFRRPSKAGIMARDGNDPRARYVAIWAAGNDGEYPDAYHFDVRRKVGASLPNNDAAETAFAYGFVNKRHPEDFTRVYPNVWVRLKREGHVFSAFVSKDGLTWRSPTPPSFTSELPTKLMVGLGLSAWPEGNPDARAQATFKNLRGLAAQVGRDAGVQ